MSLDTIRTALEKRLAAVPALGYVVALDFGDDGDILLDGTRETNRIVPTDNGTPDTTLSLSLETMEKILEGKTDPNMAVLMGKLKISGRMGVALKLASYLED